jgi:hypothetical protein
MMGIDRSFEETRQMASDTLSDMEERFAKMTAEYELKIESGETEAALELKGQMESLEMEIEAENTVFRMTFY